MSKYHVSDDGNPRVCRAVVKCPYGDQLKHYESQEQARMAFEIEQETPEAAHRFSRSMARILDNLDQDLAVPKAISGKPRDIPFYSWVESEISSHAEKLIRDDYIEPEEFLKANRDALLEFENPNVESPKFWETYFQKFVFHLDKNRRFPEKVEYPENFVANSHNEQIGNPETAKELLEILERNPTDNLDLMYNLPYSEINDELTEAGFTYVGSGMQQFVVEKDGVIWKVPLYNREVGKDGKGYVYRAIAGTECFPKHSRMIHAKTSGYVFGNSGIIAQERIDDNEDWKVSKKDLLALQLYRHFDFDPAVHSSPEVEGVNFYQSNGKIVCYDTLGETPKDMNSHMLPNVFSLNL